MPNAEFRRPLLAQQSIRPPEPMLSRAGLERPRQAALIEGLQQVVHDSVLEAAQRPVDVVHTRHEDDGHVGMALLYLLKEPEAIVFRHLHVAERDTHAALVGDLQGFIGAGDRQRTGSRRPPPTPSAPRARRHRRR